MGNSPHAFTPTFDPHTSRWTRSPSWTGSALLHPGVLPRQRFFWAGLPDVETKFCISPATWWTWWLRRCTKRTLLCRILAAYC